MFRRIVLTSASVIALTAAANATDVYVPAGPGGYKDCCGITWTGFYVGAHVGTEWSDLRVKDIDGGGVLGPGVITKNQNTAMFGGLTLGYNLQWGPVVFGLEVDLGGMDMRQDKLLTGSLANTRVGIDNGLYGDVTGRLGYAWGAALFYTKGGFAFYDGQPTISSANPIFNVRTNTDAFTGWTLGGGLEYMINPAWSVKVEYLHFDFGNQTFISGPGGGVTCPAVGCRFREDLGTDSVKIGVNYHFGSGYVPLK